MAQAIGRAVSLYLFLSLMVVCCGYSAVRGGAPERAAAALQIGAFALNLPVHFFLDQSGYRSAIVGTAAIDVTLLVALTLLAWRSTRFWPLWVAGWQLAAIVAHLTKLIDPSMMPAGYAIQAQIWAYPMLVATAAGSWRHHARVAVGDCDPSWKPMSVRSERLA